MTTDKARTPLHYIAAPYSGDPAAIAGRMACFDAHIASMLLGGHHPVSPLLFHALLGQHKVPGNWEFFESYSIGLLDRCDCITIIQLPGWESSTGVRGEIEHAMKRDIPLHYVGYDLDRYWTAVRKHLSEEFADIRHMVSRFLAENDNDLTRTRDALSAAILIRGNHIF